MQDMQTYDKYKTTLPFFENIDQEGVILYAAWWVCRDSKASTWKRQKAAWLIPGTYRHRWL